MPRIGRLRTFSHDGSGLFKKFAIYMNTEKTCNEYIASD